MRVVMLGPPGAGKGTQAVRLAKDLRIPHLSTGEMLRDAAAQKTGIGLRAEELFTEGRLVPDNEVIQIVEERLSKPDCATGCVLDGFPRTVVQAEALDRILEGAGRSIDIVLEMSVSVEEVEERMLSRGRADDTHEAIAVRMAEYQARTAPLTDYYRDRGLLTVIPGEGTLDEVAARIRRAVDDAES